jgi:hypothetical protein
MSSRALPSDATALLRAMLLGGLLTFASCAAILHTVNLTATEASGAAIEPRDADRSGPGQTEPASAGARQLVELGAPTVTSQPAQLLVSNEQAAVAILAQLLRQRYGGESR